MRLQPPHSPFPRPSRASHSSPDLTVHSSPKPTCCISTIPLHRNIQFPPHYRTYWPPPSRASHASLPSTQKLSPAPSIIITIIITTISCNWPSTILASLRTSVDISRFFEEGG